MGSYIKQFFSRNNWLKTLLLKLFLSDEEKRFFSLIAPADSVQTNSNQGYLFQQGWWQGFQQHWYRNAAQEYTPWFTYPSIAFLKPRLNKDLHILEYGGGSSTFFWARHTKHVTTLEHDEKWAQELSVNTPENCKILYQKLQSLANSTAISSHKSFHIIIVDGRQRVKCLAMAIDQLTPDGVIILDDSERPKYHPGKIQVQDAGFKEIPFWGLRHNSRQASCTSVFYRANNCLDI